MNEQLVERWKQIIADIAETRKVHQERSIEIPPRLERALSELASEAEDLLLKLKAGSIQSH